MNDEIKRRVFLTGIVGGLLGAPIAVRLFTGSKADLMETHYFSKTLKKYEAMLDVPIAGTEVSEPVSFKLNPGLGNRWKYVIFSKSLLPNEFSIAIGDDPDTFLLREGNLFFDRTTKGQEVFCGGDSICEVCTSLGKEEKSLQEIAILLKDGLLVPARRKDGELSSPDTQFERLLSLHQMPKELRQGTRWQSETGRLKPFEGFTTNYEVVGFDMVGDRKAVNVRFSAKIPDIAKLPGITARKMTPDETMTNEHQGHAWFDLESGMLIRQEIEMDTACNTPAALLSKDAPQSDREKLIHVKAKVVVQLFSV